MQTDTPVYDTNKKARIAVSEVSPHTHTHTHKGIKSIFMCTISCGRHDRELTRVSEWSVSQRSESTLTRLCCAHTCTAWLRGLRLLHSHCTNSVRRFTCFQSQHIKLCKEAVHPHLHTHTHTMQTCVILRNVPPTLSVNHPCRYTVLSLLTHTSLVMFLSSGPIQEGIWEGKGAVWLQHAPRHWESSPQATPIRRHHPQWCRCLEKGVMICFWSVFFKIIDKWSNWRYLTMNHNWFTCLIRQR